MDKGLEIVLDRITSEMDRNHKSHEDIRVSQLEMKSMIHNIEKQIAANYEQDKKRDETINSLSTSFKPVHRAYIWGKVSLGLLTPTGIIGVILKYFNMF